MVEATLRYPADHNESLCVSFIALQVSTRNMKEGVLAQSSKTAPYRTSVRQMDYLYLIL